jgi:hypothetical protein
LPRKKGMKKGRNLKEGRKERKEAIGKGKGRREEI